MSWTRNLARRATLLALAVLAVVQVLPAQGASRNLLPNPSFEKSVVPVDPGSVAGYAWQPLLPSGWVFEGATLLFDHSPHAGHTGSRGAAISGALGGGDQICTDPNAPAGLKCIRNPYDAQWRSATSGVTSTYSARPVWRTLEPVRVSAGKNYDLAFWAAQPTFDWTLLTPGEGATASVRWLNSSGRTIKVSPGGSVVGPSPLVWRYAKKTIKAPAGAVSAHILLGHTNYMTLQQVAFDDVFFGLTPPKRRR